MTTTIKRFFATALVAVSFAMSARAQEMPEMPQPTAEHQKLAQFAGEWTSEAVATMPGGEPMVCKGTESSKLMGGFWYVADGEGDMMGEKMRSLLTLGYDLKTKQYVGTFVCSAGDYLWTYKGQFDETGKKLILETEGPGMMDPTAVMKYREVLELVDENHKTFTSSVEGPDGEWQEMMTMTFERAKK